MPAQSLSGTTMHASGSMFQLSRPDLAAPSARRSARGARRAAIPAAEPAPAPRAAAVEVSALEAVTMPAQSLSVADPVEADRLYRCAILREITDLMRAHAITVREVSRALGRGGAAHA